MVSGLGAPLLPWSGFGGGSSATARRDMRGESTAGIPPISQMLTFGILGYGKARPPLISGAEDRTVGGMDEAAEV